MEMKIDKNMYLKLIAMLLCVYISILPFFQPKKVYANPLIIAGACVASVLIGLKAAGYIEQVVVPAEKLNELNEQATANLQAAFPDPAEYNKQLGVLENLSNNLLAGKDVDWSKYSGKAIYAISKAVIDVLYPYNKEHKIDYAFSTYYLGSYQQYQLFFCPSSVSGIWKTYPFTSIPKIKFKERSEDLFYYIYDLENVNYFEYARECGTFYVYNVLTDKYLKANNIEYEGLQTYTSVFSKKYTISVDWEFDIINIILGGKSGNVQKVQDINKKTANKVKLSTRLPQSVINNYNTYINGESENLVIDPTVDELPQLPEDYNPVTDDPPDLDGFQDVTPDQEPTGTPDPTPTPTPTPSTPEYDGSDWVKRIGDFFDGLLTFVKGALVPTQAIDYTPLQNMGTDFSKKFPFSLPGDIVKLYGLLQAEPKRPEFHMTFDLSKVGVPGAPIVWDIKLEEWDEAAGIVKTALYIGFLIGLAFISKNFIRN